MQVRLMKNTTGVANQAFSRYFAYTGIASLESLAPGLPFYANQYRKWNGLTGLPTANQSVQYYYPASINAAMAFINKAFFPNANTTDKGAIDSLENALNAGKFCSTTFISCYKVCGVWKSCCGCNIQLVGIRWL